MKPQLVRMAKPALSERREQMGSTLLSGKKWDNTNNAASHSDVSLFAARQEARRLMAQKGGKA